MDEEAPSPASPMIAPSPSDTNVCSPKDRFVAREVPVTDNSRTRASLTKITGRKIGNRTGIAGCGLVGGPFELVSFNGPSPLEARALEAEEGEYGFEGTGVACIACMIKYG